MDILDSGSLKIQYNRNRYYDYYTGRWLTHDPLGITPNPQKPNRFGSIGQYKDGMNLYEYAKSWPLGYNDPTGLWTKIKQFKGKMGWWEEPFGAGPVFLQMQYNVEVPYGCVGECGLYAWQGGAKVKSYNLVEKLDAFGILILSESYTVKANTSTTSLTCPEGIIGTKMNIEVEITAYKTTFIDIGGIVGISPGPWAVQIEEKKSITEKFEVNCCCLLIPTPGVPMILPLPFL